MNIQDIQFIYEYNYWANGKILAACLRMVTQEQFLAPAEFPFGEFAWWKFTRHYSAYRRCGIWLA